MTESSSRHEHVLVLAPTATDAKLCRGVLGGAGMKCVLCPDLEAVCVELEKGAGVVLLTEESLNGRGSVCLIEVLRRQPSWSDIPILVLTKGRTDSPAAMRALDTFGNVTLLDRPTRMGPLVSAVRAAVRARRRQHELREQWAERERAEQALKEVDRRKDEFLATLAHELRNPLAPLRNAVSVLRMSMVQEGGNKVLGMMERQLAHMVHLVDDLLDVSRVTTGKVTLRPERLDVSAAVQAAAETSRPIIDAAGHTLTVSLSAEPLALNADKTRFEQVLTNLLTNAAKYTPSGGRITLAVERDSSEAVIRVTDNGIGIPADMLPKVFDLFTQVGRSLDRSQGGLGIGLALVKKLVEMHGGTVTAESDGPGRGSTLTVRLPLAAEPVAAAVPTASANGATEASSPGRRVLVVDDNADGADSLAMLLELSGHTTEVARDGIAAIAAAKEFSPEVIFLDIGMPGMNGYEVAERLRQDPAFNSTVLVALTGWGSDEDRKRGAKAGFNFHLTKPVESAAVKELLDRFPSLSASISSGEMPAVNG